MAYTLESITQPDQEKIVKDSACDPRKQTRLEYALRSRTFPRVWAVDRERDCYLIMRPVVTREDGLDYYAFIDGYMYGINKVDLYGHDVYFDEKNLPSKEALYAAQQEITSAFEIFGALGTGPTDEPLYPNFTTDKGAC